ncbi:MAG: type II toxin-antitoxin system VapC family toxin [Chloroflexi bacterium]|nr:type II toxin-antitoxin system VapC family toxin [Chloroflexota bacterium]
MILLDSNIPMYLIGADHPNRDIARLSLQQCVASGERIVTDAEVLQEIIHRYVSIHRRDAIEPAFDAMLGLVDEVFPIERQDVERAQRIVMSTARLSARDAIHVAVMQRRDIPRIMSFDHGFDDVPGLTRVG